MIRLLQALSIALALSACATTVRQGPLDAQGFSDAYIARLHELAPRYEVRRSDPMELNVASEEGAELSVHLASSYSDYLSDVSRLAEVLDISISGVQQAIRSELDTELRIEQILPVVKDKAYVSDEAQSLQLKQGADADNGLYSESLNSDLVVLYVQDNKRSVRFLSKASVASLALPAAELRVRAVNNFRQRLSGIQSQQKDDVYLLQLDAFYEASLLLVDEIWQSPALKVDGDIVVAVPARDVLMVSGTDSANLDELRVMAADIAQRTGHVVSPQLFVRREGKWLLFK